MRKLTFLFVMLLSSINVCLADIDWAGNYIVRSFHNADDKTAINYVDNFEMTIEEMNNNYYITSFMGLDLKLTYENGFKLEVVDEGIAYVNIYDYSKLLVADNQRLYRVIPSELSGDVLSEWYFTMNSNGDIEIGGFAVAIYNWSESDGYWIYSNMEALYMDMTAVKDLMLTDWSGKYSVNASVTEVDPTMQYPKDFDIVIENIDGYYYVTSLLGYEIKKPQNFGEYYLAPFRLIDNGDATATIYAQTDTGIGIVRNDNDRIYLLGVWDRASQDYKTTWTIKKNKTGTITLENFDIFSYKWDPWKDTHTDSKLEAKYSLMVGRPVEAEDGIGAVINDQQTFRVIGRSIALDNIADLSVYTINGTLYYQGRTDLVIDLPAGMYVVRVGDSVRKVAIK